MKKQITTLAIALTVLCGGITAANACDCKCGCQCPPPPPHVQKMKMTPEEFQARMERKIERFDTALGLTDAQKAQAKEIRENAHQKVKPLVDKKIAVFKQIREIRQNDNIAIKDQDKKVDALKAQLKVIDQDIRQVHQDTKKAFKAILTEEQQTKLDQMKAEHRKHHRGHRPCPTCGPCHRMMY